MGDKSAQNLLDALNISQERPIWRLLAGLGIRHVGAKISQILAEHFQSVKSIAAATEEEISEIDGVGPVLARSVGVWFRQERNQELLQRLAKHNLRMVEPEAEPGAGAERGALEGEIFVFTGSLDQMTRDEAGELVMQFGAKSSGSVSKKTTFVVAGPGAGSKRAKAEALGVAILDEQGFIDLLSARGLSLPD
jgi:DNA ligase (NAD+)